MRRVECFFFPLFFLSEEGKGVSSLPLRECAFTDSSVEDLMTVG